MNLKKIVNILNIVVYIKIHLSYDYKNPMVSLFKVVIESPNHPYIIWYAKVRKKNVRLDRSLQYCIFHKTKI